MKKAEMGSKTAPHHQGCNLHQQPLTPLRRVGLTEGGRGGRPEHYRVSIAIFLCQVNKFQAARAHSSIPNHAEFQRPGDLTVLLEPVELSSQLCCPVLWRSDSRLEIAHLLANHAILRPAN